MRTTLITIGMFLAIITSFSCSKDSNNFGDEFSNTSMHDTIYIDEKESTDYYVKYEIIIQPTNYITSSKIKISTEKGIRNFNMVSSNFSEIFGPVEKGFTASINAYLASQAIDKEFTIRIYVCRGNEPFALKAYNYSTENSNSTPLSAMYTIDY